MQKRITVNSNLFLLLPLGFTILLLGFRIIFTGRLTFSFLAWNLYLALLPLILARVAATLQPGWLQGLLLLAWLALFPNAPYIVTDLVHLGKLGGMPFYFDLVLLVSAAWNGLLLGFLSLQTVERILARRMNDRLVMLAIMTCIALCAFGIYLGRYQRLNSWEIISDPVSVFNIIAERMIDPFSHPRTWGVTILFSGWFGLTYFGITRWARVSARVGRLGRV